MVWVDAERARRDVERRAAKRERRAERAAAERQAAIGRQGAAVTRYGYAPRAECQDCDFTLSKSGRVDRRTNSVRAAALQHVTEHGHEVHVIIQDVTHYTPA